MAKVDLLSAGKVKALKAPGDYLDGRGLYLQVRSESSKSWLLKYSIEKRAREMGLGPAADISLAKARELRDYYRSLLKQGVDPLDHRHAERATRILERAKAVTFKDAAARFITANRPGWKNIKHAAQWDSTLSTYAYPKIGALPVQSVDTGLVMSVLDPIWSVKPETASRVRGRIESVIDAAKARGEFEGENPARWKGHLENLLPKPSKVRRVKNHAALPWPDLPAFMQDLRQRDGVAAAAMKFLILNASRTSEVLGCRRSEIDRERAFWTIPGSRMKNGKDHQIPLTASSLAVLDDMEKISKGEFVFPGASSGRPLSNMALLVLLRRMNRGDITSHGFRSTFRDWAAERGFPDAVAEAALAHTVPDKVVAAYLRTNFFELRRRMMDDWAAYTSSEPKKNVVKFENATAANSRL